MAKMDRNQTNTERMLTRYRNKIQDFSIKAGEALTARNYEEVTLAYGNGIQIAKEASIIIAQLQETEFPDLCKQIESAYTNLEEIQKTANQIKKSEDNNTDNDLENLLGEDN